MWEEVEAFLDRFELVCSYEVPMQLPIRALIRNIVQELERSDQAFAFTPTSRSRYLWGGENLALDLLDLVNRGL